MASAAPIEYRKRHRLIGASLVALGCYGTMMFAQFALRAVSNRSAVFSALIILLELATMVFPTLVGFAHYTRTGQPSGYLLWLRRFRKDYGARVRFHRIIQAATEGVLTPVTIEDSSFSSSSTRGLMRSWVVTGIAAAIYLFVLLMVVVLAIVSSVEEPLQYRLLAICVVVAAAVLPPIAGRALWRWRGREQPTEIGADVFAALAEYGDRSGGVVVFRTPDVEWRKAVELAVRYAEVVVIDITELSENLVWEVQLVKKVKSPASVLFTCEEGVDVAKISRALRIKREQLKSRLIWYPARELPRWRRLKAYKNITRRLQTEILESIEAA